MTQMIVIPGLSPATKLPGFYGETKYAAGAISASSIPLTVLLVGGKTSAGDLAVDSTPRRVLSEDDCDAAAGPGSELACMGYAAIRIPGVNVFLAAQKEAVGAVAATATITIAGAWTAAGSIALRLSGRRIDVTVGASDTAANVATAIAAAINARPRLPFTASAADEVVTITTKSKSPRSNAHALFKDLSQAPAGLTATLAGGASLTGGGVRFKSGAGNDSPDDLLSAIYASEFSRIAVACGDATLDAVQLAKWKTQLNRQAGPTEGKLQHLVTASTGSPTAATTLTKATLNDARIQHLFLENAEAHPSEIAAVFAAIRAAKEQTDPDAAYDDDVLPGIAPQAERADWPGRPLMESLLGEGVTPLYTAPDGTVRVARSITTRCLNGSVPDYRVLDTSEAVVPDFVRRTLEIKWTTEWKIANPRVDDDPPPEAKESPAGVGTPSGWNATVYAILKGMERGEGFPAPILVNVDGRRPVSTYDKTAKRIMSAVPVEPAPNQHSIGVSVRQMTTA